MFDINIKIVIVRQCLHDAIPQISAVVASYRYFLYIKTLKKLNQDASRDKR